MSAALASETVSGLVEKSGHIKKYWGVRISGMLPVAVFIEITDGDVYPKSILPDVKHEDITSNDRAKHIFVYRLHLTYGHCQHNRDVIGFLPEIAVS